jgi:hypothetical protein
MLTHKLFTIWFHVKRPSFLAQKSNDWRNCNPSDPLDSDSGRVFHFKFGAQFSSSRESNPQRRLSLVEGFLRQRPLQLVSTSWRIRLLRTRTVGHWYTGPSEPGVNFTNLFLVEYFIRLIQNDPPERGNETKGKSVKLQAQSILLQVHICSKSLLVHWMAITYKIRTSFSMSRLEYPSIKST